MKRTLYILLTLWLLHSPDMYGQHSERLKEKMENLFTYLTHSKMDSTYGVRNGYRFIIKPKQGISFGETQIRWSDTGNQTLIKYGIRSVPVWKMGANITYRNLTVGFQSNIGQLFNGKNVQDIDYTLSSYGLTLGGELLYSVTNRTNLLDKSAKEDKLLWDDWVESFHTERLQVNGYYVFNNKRFCYPASITQSYRQTKSCGSIIVGLSANYHAITFKEDLMPPELLEVLGIENFFLKINNFSVNLNAGYAYNWVIGRRWMIHGSALPSAALYRRSKVVLLDGTESTSDKQLCFQGIVRMGAMWDYKRQFCGFTAMLYINELSRDPFLATDMYLRSRLYYGFRIFK